MPRDKDENVDVASKAVRRGAESLSNAAKSGWDSAISGLLGKKSQASGETEEALKRRQQNLRDDRETVGQRIGYPKN